MQIALIWVCVVLVALELAWAIPPVQVVASVRGKKYDVTAETVEEFTSKVEEAAGLTAGQQSVLFRGKVLKATDRFDDLGVNAGDVLNVVKGRKPSAVQDEPLAADASGLGGLTKPAAAGGMPSMADLQGMSQNPEEMQKAMKAMDQLLDSDFVDEYFSDEEKLETARLEMLSKLDQYEQMMPGFKAQAQEIASDPKKWREAMGQAKQQITNMKAQRDALKKSKEGAATDSSAEAAKKTEGIADSGVDDVPEEDDN